MDNDILKSLIKWRKQLYSRHRIASNIRGMLLDAAICELVRLKNELATKERELDVAAKLLRAANVDGCSFDGSSAEEEEVIRNKTFEQRLRVVDSPDCILYWRQKITAQAREGQHANSNKQDNERWPRHSAAYTDFS